MSSVGVKRRIRRLVNFPALTCYPFPCCLVVVSAQHVGHYFPSSRILLHYRLGCSACHDRHVLGGSDPPIRRSYRTGRASWIGLRKVWKGLGWRVYQGVPLQQVGGVPN